MPKISQETKEQVAKVIKEVTGRDIKEIIPESDLREKLYEMLNDFKVKKHMSPTTAIETLRKYIRHYQIAKEAVKVIFRIKYPNIEFKNYVPRNKRNLLYFQYIKLSLEDNKQELAIKKTIRDFSSMKNTFLLIEKIQKCTEDQKLFVFLDESLETPIILHCKLLDKKTTLEEYKVANLNLITRPDEADYTILSFESISEIHSTYYR